MERFYIWAAEHSVEVYTTFGLFAAWAVKGYRDYTSGEKKPRFERAISNFMCALLLLVFVVPALEYFDIKPELIPFIGAAFGAMGTESIILLTSKVFHTVISQRVPVMSQTVAEDIKIKSQTAQQRTPGTSGKMNSSTGGYQVPEPPMPLDKRN
ncbi:phage holin family protein [Anaerobiospirillum thomasii]|uniref:Holin n=1 Tax=Anaerobiospirillum thomasii TaxID=179995 RepID=A0A2X0WU97_9GAMM|nr:phage holin family protein [Anaerobiospirillum thomasii]SPT70082.1 Uncharacterised protein [Anaerobiospirillum thomasii]